MGSQIRDDNEFLERIFTYAPFEDPSNMEAGLFEDAVMHEIHRQSDAIPSYARFISNFNHGLPLTQYSEIPALPIQVFKELGTDLSSIERNDKVITLQSSATSGNASAIVVDRITARRQSRAMASVMKELIGTSRRPMLIIDAPPIGINSGELGARYAASLGYRKFASETEYLLQISPSGALELRSDWLEVLSRFVSTHDDPVIFGFTYILYSVLLQPLMTLGYKIEGQGNLLVIHIGGWKKLEDEKIGPEDFRKLACKYLGVESHRIFDIYGFTEQMGINYPECQYGWKHVPIFARARVFDPLTLRPTQPGQSGLLEFTSPIPYSYPGNSILTDDVGFLNPVERCSCSWFGQTFKVIGRRKKAEIRGCGDILGESLGRPRAPVTNVSSDLQVVFPRAPKNGIQTKYSTDLTGLSELIDQLNESRQSIQNLRTVDILQCIDKLRSQWMEIARSPLLLDLRNNGLSFLISWSEPDNLRRMLDSSVRGGAASLEVFSEFRGKDRQYIRAYPRGIVAQWVSGNVPLLAMFPIVQAWLCRNPSISRLSSRTNGFMELMLEPLQNLAQTDPVAHILLSNTVLVAFDKHNHAANSILSKSASTRIAWGGKQAVQEISGLPKSHEAVDLMFGPRTSLAVTHEEMLRTEKQIRSLTRRIASDVFVFNQIACASPHTLYIQTSNMPLIRNVCTELSAQMEILRERFGDPPIDDSLKSQIQLSRTLGQFSGEVYGPDDLTFTILAKTSNVLPPPTFGRTLVVEPINSVMDVVPKLVAEVQTIGVALPEEVKWRFADAAGRAGAARFTEIGKMTEFDEPWDGLFVLDAMLRYSTLGSA